MCEGQTSALPNTHGTITATLILETSMPSIVLVAPVATVTSMQSSASISDLKSSGLGLTTTSTVTGSPSKNNQASSTGLVPAASETRDPTPTLTKPQIVGITVASVGGGCVALGVLLIFICLRRRKQRRMRESDMLPFQLDPPAHLMDKNKYKPSFKGPAHGMPGGTINGIAGRVAPPVPPRIDTSSPNMFSRRSIRPDTIGLAISPETNPSVDKQRRSSKLLPDKPTLTLKMPQSSFNGGLSFSQPSSAPLRQSTATHFEEDEFDSADTAVNADEPWGRKSTEKILDNPTGTWPTLGLVNHQPTGTVEFGGGRGDYHWRPPQASNKPSVSPDYYIKPLNVSRGVSSFSQPRRPDEYPKPPEQSLQLQIPDQSTRPITTSSSLYSAHTSLPGSDNGRQSAPRIRKSYRLSGPYDPRQSGGSLTSFDSLDSGFSPDGPELKASGLDLSPVMESPTSGGGISPVTYPKIPGRLSGTILRLVRPPPQPDFTKAIGAGAVGGGKGIQPWRQAELAAQRERERMDHQSQAQTRAAARELQIQVGMQRMHQPESSAESRNIYNFPAPIRSQTAPVLRSQTHVPLGDTSREGLRQGLRINQLQVSAQPGQPDITFTRSSSQMSQYSQASKNSTSSSLLAKRLGEQKAATLTLKSEEEKSRKWRVLKKDEIEQAKQSGWRPILGSGGSGGGGSDRDQYGTSTTMVQKSNGGLGNVDKKDEKLETPKTPGWIPRLTPTRRGDELFLSVQ
jgi:hypothetical protein